MLILKNFIFYMKLLKVLICILFLGGIVEVWSQVKDLQDDSLSKYSYTIFGQVGSSPILNAGTCFFIREKNNIFLVTAKHTLYYCDTITGKQTYKFETANVYLPSTSAFLPVSVPKINDTCIIDNRDPDLFIAKIDTTWGNMINTIERFVMPPLRKFGKIEVFGQGFRIDSAFVSFVKPKRIELKENTFKYYTYAPISGGYLDTIHQFIETEQVNVGAWMKGYSGSPVFLQDLGSGKWRWCGVYVMGFFRVSEKQPGGLMVISADYVLRTIRSSNFE